MTQSGALSKRLACGDLQEVGEALQSQRTQILAHPNGRVAIVGPIVNALPGKMLKALLHGISDTPVIATAIAIRLLTSFRSLLTEPEQRALVTQLPKSHPLRKSWTSGTDGSRVILCLPLSGSFGLTGQRMKEQLEQLSAVEPTIFYSRLHFIDCADESWQPALLESSVKAHRATAVFSLTSTRVQSSVRAVVNDLNLLHFTLNPVSGNNDASQNTWTLNVSPELTVGTAVTDALKELDRRTESPLPLKVAVVTDKPEKSPIVRYLRPYKNSFSGLTFYAAPTKCAQELTPTKCAQESQREWIRLVKRIQQKKDRRDADELLFLDLGPMTLVTFLKYWKNQWVQEIESSKEALPSRPLLYADHRAVSSPNKTFMYEPDTPSTTAIALSNQFTRLAGQYSREVRFLIHIDPLSPHALEFNARVTPHLSSAATHEVITLMEGLRLVDTLIVESRKNAIPILKLNSIVELARSQTAGLTFSQAKKTLPRLRIVRTKDGVFPISEPR